MQKKSCKSIHPFKRYSKKPTKNGNKFLDKISSMSVRITTGKRGVIQSKRSHSPDVVGGADFNLISFNAILVLILFENVV